MADAAGGYKIPESVLVVIHTRALDVLLIERADRPGFWQSVTGSRHAGEAFPDTAVREVGEETGIVIGASDLVDWRLANRFRIFERWRGRFAPGVTHNTEHVFGLCLPDRVPVRLEPREHLAHEWLPWQAALARVFSWTNADALRLLGLRGGNPPPC